MKRGGERKRGKRKDGGGKEDEIWLLHNFYNRFGLCSTNIFLCLFFFLDFGNMRCIGCFAVCVEICGLVIPGVG